MERISTFNLNFVGIGAQKAGTSWLSAILDSHPEVCISIPKEIDFFNTYGSFYQYTPIGKNYPDIHKYAQHFSHAKAGQLVGEISPNYLYDWATAERLHVLFPDVKILVCLRDPVQRAFSQYNFARYKHKQEHRDFDQAIRQEPEYIARGLYAKQLQAFFKLFRHEQFFFLTLDEVKKNPAKLCEKVYDFLGVDSVFLPDKIHKKSNPSQQIRFTGLLKLEHFAKRFFAQLNLGGFIVWLKKMGIDRIYHQLNFSDKQFPPMSQESRSFLKAQFKEDIEKLEELLGRDFSHWK